MEKFEATRLNALFDDDEWEALCDNCGICCFYKVEDEDTEEVFFTSIHCPHLSMVHHGCEVYNERFKRMPTCVKIAPETIQRQSTWMPITCAYRCIAESRPIAPWHPLLQLSPDELEVQPALKTLREKLDTLNLLPDHTSAKEPKTHQKLKRRAIKGQPENPNFESTLIENIFLDEI